MSDRDWLAPPQLPAIVQDETKFGALVASLKKLSPKQRHYLNALQEACFDDDIARKDLANKGIKVSWQAVRKWEAEPAFVKAMEQSIEYVLAAAAVNQVGVVAQLQRAVRVNGRTIKCKTENGEEYEKFVDAPALNTALDRLAKRVRMFGDDQQNGTQKQLPAFVVGVQVNMPGAKPGSDVIDVQVMEVKT